MPGHKNPKDPGADYLSDFILYRSTAASDTPPPAFTEEIDLTRSVSAQNNTLKIFPVETSGSGNIKYHLYVRFPTAPVAIRNTWILQSSSAFVASLAPVEFTGLYAAIYRLAVENQTPGDEFDTYISFGS